MFRQTSARGLTMMMLLIALVISASGLSSLAGTAPQKKRAGAQKKTKKQETPRGTPVLWREPDDIATRDLYVGPGGETTKPDLARVMFIEKQEGGTNTKYRVRDAAGREWVAKLGKEAQSETAAVRLLWAVGYATEINYLEPHAEITGKGAFENVRFEARPKGVKRLDEWAWKNNPFTGKREFQGLKVMMLLLNNWDIKDENNKILYVKNGADGRGELHYIISDLGATFGKSGGLGALWRITRSRNNPEDYANSKFVDDVREGRVKFKYAGKGQDILEDITVEDVNWIAALLDRLSDKQLGDAFRAANYTQDEVDTLTAAVRARINELADLRATTEPAGR